MNARSGVKEKVDKGAQGLRSQLPVDRLTDEFSDFGKALGEKGLSKLGGGIDSLTDKLNDYASGKSSGSALLGGATSAVTGLVKDKVKSGASGVASSVKDAVKSAMPGSDSHKLKVTNIVESIDVPVSREVAYRQWTEFESFPSFMKKVESVKQEEDEVLNWKAQIFLSHRTWKATITDQVPNERIVWKSEADKGHVDGAVTFHELAPDLTRVLVTLEYHPKGLFEHTGNIWRAQGRRVRVELKHFRRHVANATLIHPEEVEGWTGEIHDGEVTDAGDGGDDSDESGGEDSPKKRSRSKSREADEDKSADEEDQDSTDEDLESEDEEQESDDEDLESEDEEQESDDEDLESEDEEQESDDEEEEAPPIRRGATDDSDDGDESARSSGARKSSRSSGRGRGGRTVGRKSERKVGDKSAKSKERS